MYRHGNTEMRKHVNKERRISVPLPLAALVEFGRAHVPALLERVSSVPVDNLPDRTYVEGITHRQRAVGPKAAQGFPWRPLRFQATDTSYANNCLC